MQCRSCHISYTTHRAKTSPTRELKVLLYALPKHTYGSGRGGYPQTVNFPLIMLACRWSTTVPLSRCASPLILLRNVRTQMRMIFLSLGVASVHSSSPVPLLSSPYLPP